MDMWTVWADHRRMARRPTRQFRRLYIGEWISRLGRTQAEVAKEAGIGAPYLNNLIAGDRRNPGAHVLLEISEVLGISVNDLYRQPPPREAIEAVERLTPAEIATLGRLFAGMRGPGHK